MNVLVVRGVALLALAGVILTGCIPVYRPGRQALDDVWDEWMLTGHYGLWRGGGEKPWGVQREDDISRSPVGAGMTRYGIEVWGDAGPFANAKWSHIGGLVDREKTHDRSIELFGRETALSHYPGGVSQYGRDYSYDFFLLVRPRPEGRATLVRKWSFAPEDIALVIDPRSEALLGQLSIRESQRASLIARSMRHKVEGSLTFDPATKTATVTIKGLKQPFEERVDLSQLIQ